MQRLKHHNTYHSIIISENWKHVCMTEEYFNELWYLHMMMYQNVYKKLSSKQYYVIHIFPSIKFRIHSCIYSMTSLCKNGLTEDREEKYQWLSMDATIQAIHSFLFYTITHMLNFHNRQVLLLLKKVSC